MFSPQINVLPILCQERTGYVTKTKQNKTKKLQKSQWHETTDVISSSVCVSKAGLQARPCLAGNSGTQGNRVSILASVLTTSES